LGDAKFRRSGDVRANVSLYTRCMETPNSIDAGISLKAYAIAVASAGVLLTGWGPMWLGTDLPGQPWYLAALIRVTGSILVAAACCAWQISSGSPLPTPPSPQSS